MSASQTDGPRIVSDDAWPLDRGLQFGDGLFETVWLDAGQPFAFEWHWARFAAGCRVLMLPVPDRMAVLESLHHAWRAAGSPRGALAKWLWTAGPGARGYARPQPLRPALFARCGVPGDDPLVPDVAAREPEHVLVLSEVAASVQPHLACIKHLNRLDQVMARARLERALTEQTGASGTDVSGGARNAANPSAAGTSAGVAARDATRHDALLCDAEGRVVCATAANLAFRIDGRWRTPTLARAGVAGTRRAAWLAADGSGGVAESDALPRLEIGDLGLDDLCRADAGVLLGTGTGLARIAVVCDDKGRELCRFDRAALAQTTLSAYRQSLRRRLAACPPMWPGPDGIR